MDFITARSRSYLNTVLTATGICHIEILKIGTMTSVYIYIYTYTHIHIYMYIVVKL